MFKLPRTRTQVVCLLLTVLVGCSTGYAPVTEQSLGTPSQRSYLGQGEYRVRPGDTLIAIAFKLGIDYRELARINNLRDQDLIYAGQILQTKSLPVPVARNQTTAPRTGATSPTQTGPNTAQRTAQRTPQTTRPAQPARSEPITAASGSGPVAWQWPHGGRILARFSSQEGGNKGLDISGTIGDPVKAASDGKVVYAGSGLLGYGNLVIISHNRDFLSAYAHNSRILVKENQRVKAGETVAELGNTGASVPMLHFEIRRDGKPVDPLRYLPRR